jgi:nucleoside-triphosphatase THEP1
MKPKILITGKPKSGKSTLISKLIEHFQKNYNIYGFITPEVRKNNKRIGFDMEDFYSKKRLPLARVGNYNTNFKLGKYSVFVEDFEVYIKNLLYSMEKISDSLFCIDEIGKMELFSKNFQKFIKNLFQSNNTIIATLGLNLKHPIKNYILAIPDLALFHINKANQDEIFAEIVSLVK